MARGKIRDQIYNLDRLMRRDDLFARGWLFENAIPHASLGVLYAYRGTYKTWTAMDFALACALGRNWLAYPGTQPRRTLFVDGEMALPDFRERWGLLLGNRNPPSNLFVLTADDLAWDANRMVNLAVESDRKELLAAAVEFEIDVVVLDNRTSLLRGLDENDNAALDSFKSWLIRFRQDDRSLLMVHHSGKSGELRGASALEDHLDYSIRLWRTGQEVRLQWDKSRGAMPQPAEVAIELDTESAPGVAQLNWEDPAMRKKKKRKRAGPSAEDRD